MNENYEEYTSTKHTDSKRTAESKATAVHRRDVRRTHKANGGRW